MRAIIQPGNIHGTIAAPSSKSMTQRAYAAALLHKGRTIIYNAGKSEDEKAALAIIQDLGAEIISAANNTIEITSNGVRPRTDIINCGESGLCARLFTPIAALSASPITITGRGSLMNRPMTGFKEVFESLSIDTHDFKKFLPITLAGNLKAKTIHIDASSGSQLLSGLLFALSYAVEEAISIHVTGLTSKPYIDLTLDVLQQFGKTITNNNYTEFVIDPTKFTTHKTVNINIEGDWSGATNLLVAGAIAGDITITNLQTHSKQADKSILTILQQAGASVTIQDDAVRVQSARLRSFDFDATDCPDLFPILAVLASCCNGDSTIRGVHRLFHKESNRAESISEMLMNFDVPFSIEDDMLCISGVRQLQGTVIDSYNDHRIAMAAAVGALRAGTQVDITGAESVNKSYPGFFNHISLCGVRSAIID